MIDPENCVKRGAGRDCGGIVERPHRSIGRGNTNRTVEVQAKAVNSVWVDVLGRRERRGTVVDDSNFPKLHLTVEMRERSNDVMRELQPGVTTLLEQVPSVPESDYRILAHVVETN